MTDPRLLGNLSMIGRNLDTLLKVEQRAHQVAEYKFLSERHERTDAQTVRMHSLRKFLWPEGGA